MLPKFTTGVSTELEEWLPEMGMRLAFDWNGDFVLNQRDIVAALQTGAYLQGAG